MLLQSNCTKLFMLTLLCCWKRNNCHFTQKWMQLYLSILCSRTWSTAHQHTGRIHRSNFSRSPLCGSCSGRIHSLLDPHTLCRCLFDIVFSECLCLYPQQNSCRTGPRNLPCNCWAHVWKQSTTLTKERLGKRFVLRMCFSTFL